MAIFQDKPISWYLNATILDFFWSKDDQGDGDNWSYKTSKVVVTDGAIRCAKIQSKHCHQNTSIQLFTGRILFLLSNQQWQITGRRCHLTGHNMISNKFKIHLETDELPA